MYDVSIEERARKATDMSLSSTVFCLEVYGFGGSAGQDEVSCSFVVLFCSTVGLWRVGFF